VNIDDYRREFLLLDVGLFTHWAKFVGHLLSPILDFDARHWEGKRDGAEPAKEIDKMI
jgi:hypothetical protein